jgi:hypothetical protein
MRGLCNKPGWEKLQVLIIQFFTDASNRDSRQTFDVMDFKKWLEKKGILQTKFRAKSKS